MQYDILASTDLGEGDCRTVDIGDQKILVARVDGRCHAIDAICPHAGAPLGEGVLRDGIIICPWHKAAFDVTTGARTEPPAVDDVASFPVQEANGRITLTIADQPSPAPQTRNTDARCMVIIGAGAAGAAAAQTLREAGFAGRVVMIGREDRLPYDRTVLSKYTLSGKSGGEKTPLQDAAYYARHGIERRIAEVTELDPASRTLRLADGTQFGYDEAVVATGGRPRPLPIPGHDLPGVHLLRTPDDAAAIVATAERSHHAVVIGGGFIGLEAAASLRERGLAVTVVSPDRAPLERQLGPAVAGAFQHVHEQQGVVFKLGVEVASIEGSDRVEHLRLKDGAVIPADMVVAGLGIAPATEFLQRVTLRDDGAVDVDRTLRIAPHLYAAGDIAAFPLYGEGEQVRVEHWRVAQQQGRIAALNMLGGEVPYQAAPYFWTIHYLKRLDYVGHTEHWDGVIIDGELATPNFLAFYLQGEIVRAVAGWGRDRQMAAAIPLLSARHDWSVAGLRAALPAP